MTLVAASCVDEVLYGPSFVAFGPPDPSVLARGKPPPADGACQNALWNRCRNDFATQLGVDKTTFSDGVRLRQAISRKFYLPKASSFVAR
ncbi:hypothetical protein AAVH_06735 [Aphelenchoides avenae]|nr:hypothetical protein AAVH_06735 [Aphelenchus avenae]